MSLFTDHPRLRWTAPLAGLALAAAGTALAGTSAGAADLEPRTAQQLITEIGQAAADVAAGTPAARGMSGTVVQTSDLGLPDLAGLVSGGPGGGSSELSATVTGTHTWRVWYAGPDKVRLALVGTGGESDVIRNGREVWTWSSQTKTATRYQLPERDQGAPTPLPTPSGTGALAGTPAEMARQLLDRIDPSTEVAAPRQVTVAGRDAYELSLVPRTAGTLVAKVTIAVDGEYKVPLRVQVFSTRTQAPAFEAAFTSVDFAVPEARQFQFTPPPGTTVRQGDPAASAPGATSAPGADKDARRPDGTEPTVVGADWATVMVGTLPSSSAATSAPSGGSSGGGGDTAGSAQDAAAMLSMLRDRLPAASGSWGKGRVLEGTLFTLVITDDDRYAIGAVEPAVVYRALAGAR